MSNVNPQDFLNTLKYDYSQKHRIHATTSRSTTQEPFPYGIAVMEYYVRPQEIQSCSWRVDKYGNRSDPRECACEDIPNHAACIDGYETVKRNIDQTVLEKNPNSIIDWCWKNVPDQYKDHNLTSKRSWIIGCLDGIRGDHKAL